MSPTCNFPDPKTIAFGAVATGSINAHDAAIVAGIINRKGWIPIASENAARIGSMIEAVATFDVTSVRKFTISVTIRMIRNSGRASSETSC